MIRTHRSSTRGAAVSRIGARPPGHHTENLLLEHGPEARMPPRDAGAAVRTAAPTRTAAALKTLSAL